MSCFEQTTHLRDMLVELKLAETACGRIIQSADRFGHKTQDPSEHLTLPVTLASRAPPASLGNSPPVGKFTQRLGFISFKSPAMGIAKQATIPPTELPCGKVFRNNPAKLFI